MTMYAAGKLAQVTNEMRNNGLSILGISEARYIGSGQQRLATGELLLYSVVTKRKTQPAHKGYSIASIQISTERIDWLGITRLPDHHGFLQDNRKENSHEYHSVQCSYN